MIEMARIHAPARAPLPVRPTQATRRGVMDSLALIVSDAPGLAGDEALAERERIRVETSESRQQVLTLGSVDA